MANEIVESLDAFDQLRIPGGASAAGSVSPGTAKRLTGNRGMFKGDGDDIVATTRQDLLAPWVEGLNEPRGPLWEGSAEADEWNFFEPVPDPECGYRLHMADLAVNKVLAAGGRRAPRDYVDLVLIHEHVMPLWHALWAAPSKDQSWTPVKLLEKVARTNQFRQEDFDSEVASMAPVDAGEIGAKVRAALEEAREVFVELVGTADAARLFVTGDGQVVTDPSDVGRPGIVQLDAKRGGAWPSGPDIDALLIRRVAEAHGWEGDGQPVGRSPCAKVEARRTDMAPAGDPRRPRTV